MSIEVYNNLKKLRCNINNKRNSQDDIDYIINYEDSIILNEKLKNFLNVNKDQYNIKNIYSYFLNYIKKENLLSENKRNININNELKNLFNITDDRAITIINIGMYINKLLDI